MRVATLVDIGANLAHDSFDPDRDAVLERARAAGVAALVVTGSTLDDSDRAIDLARRHPGMLRATAGVHPHHATALRDADANRLARLLRDPLVVAAGLVGDAEREEIADAVESRLAEAVEQALAAPLAAAEPAT